MKIRQILIAFLAISLLISFLQDAEADERSLVIKQRKAIPKTIPNKTALVIGNSNYEEISKLKNPENDAQDMAKVLRELGFKVTLLTNTTYLLWAQRQAGLVKI